MAEIPAFLLRHTVTVEPWAGEGSFGPVYGPPVEVRCFQDDRRRLTRDQGGNEVTSPTTLYMRLDVACPVGSRITLQDGRKAIVMQALRRDGGGLATPDHLEILLT